MLTLTQDKSDIQNAFQSFRCCVLIPTYNNSRTLQEVVEQVSRYNRDIVVVNDGSTDNTAEVLASLPGVQVVSYSPNRGKGAALRTGFAHAYRQGYHYAITIDSDGQHFAEDLPKFLDKLRENSRAIIIGARNMDQASVPGKSSFGHKFSNFWFKLETGIEAPDTQSGYRLYPLEPLSQMKFYTSKYEFEIEVIVRAAWRGVDVCSVPVRVYYPPAEERVTHFRPFKDFSRISVLNTVLVTLALLYHIPLRLFRQVRKKSLRQVAGEILSNGNESNLRKASAIGLGIFLGIAPIWGYQILSALALAHWLRLNKALTVLASNISIPPMIPLIIFLSYQTGGWLLGSEGVAFGSPLSWEFIRPRLFQYVLGSFCFATIAALSMGSLSFFLLSLFRRNHLKEA